MGAYAENRTCDPQMLISMDGAKSLRIDLLRDVDAKSMAAEIEKALEKNLPPSVRSVSSIRASNLSISGWDGSKLWPSIQLRRPQMRYWMELDLCH